MKIVSYNDKNGELQWGYLVSFVDQTVRNKNGQIERVGDIMSPFPAPSVNLKQGCELQEWERDIENQLRSSPELGEDYI